MTNFVDLMKSDLEEAYQRFVRAFDGVTKEEANAFPVANLSSQIKSMTWLAWHTARELDFQIAFLAKEEPIWHSQKWEEKFPFDVADWKHSLVDAQRIWVDDTSILLAYLKAAKDYAKSYIDKVDESELAEIIS
ncbi:hypothetical protein HMPREF9318_00915 [Streptococcus urinalis FB127-CNA-2]|uniref:DinB-like domain-containing protein n=1 Tax=Streptococcus urinalis 2285-97 TaxID=764291 RepID=G5KGP9_9STRE|nr:DinB family protein [Streptococcus urinalis]EHJ57784.1 hypothetical protein STRUR_0071 [Streptococcus urinalis 2285-97]EKS20961.1 hypothetical protein HMPREF9318_00915 [Streptococcus urinalis FB127-CNA-2]VEF30970.1 Uncharacterised protein [Streptococcus urinalis]